jgi:protease YdgD
MIRLAGALALGLTALTAGAVEAQSDVLDALTERTDILGWEAVGRLDFESRTRCSAVLIEPKLVLTAAHCLFDGANVETRTDPTKLLFQAGLRDGVAIASRTVAYAVVHARFDPNDSASAESVRHDAALLQLSDPIPATTADPFGVSRARAEGQEVAMLSYGRGRENAMSIQAGCRLLARGRGLMAFDCRSHPGSSGAPIFDVSGRSPTILSIVSGTGSYEGEPATFGMDLPVLVADLKTALRRGQGVWPDAPQTERRTISPSTERAAGSARFVKP